MRQFAAIAFLGLFILMTGCLGGGLDESALSANASYTWETDTDVTFNVTGGSFHAVYRIEDGTPVAAFRDTEFQGEQPISISAVQFRYPNGTIVGADAMEITQTGGRTIIVPPAEEGKLAYSASSLPKDFQVGLNRSGSYEVILPPGMRIGFPFMGHISPGGAELSVRNDRTHLVWESLDGGSIDLHYYLERDFWIFTGIVVLGLIGAVVTVLYFRLQIRQLRRRIEESGFDLER